jgi:hypothetical protein
MCCEINGLAESQQSLLIDDDSLNEVPSASDPGTSPSRIPEPSLCGPDHRHGDDGVHAHQLEPNPEPPL